MVIDAGHGGHDSGCLGANKIKEKDVALGIALKLGKLIEDQFPDVRVIYTRKTDVFLELHERAEIANSANADLFICVHCNSACFMDKKKRKEVCNQEIHGVESWIMGLHKTEANLEIAKRENNVMLLEKDYVKQYNGFDPNSPEAEIIFSLYQNTFMDQSLNIASLIQKELGAKGRSMRGVKQAGFWVLYKTTMPSVLIETGFLSNPSEERYLGSSKGQQEVASGIYQAFRKYRRSLAMESGNYIPEDKEPIADDTDKQVQEPIQPAAEKEATRAVTSADNSDDAPKGVYYSVQIISSTTKLESGNAKFKGLTKVKEEKLDKGYKYYSGVYNTMDDAVKGQSQLRDKGFKDAFVVAFRNDVRIPVSEAREALKNSNSK